VPGLVRAGQARRRQLQFGAGVVVVTLAAVVGAAGRSDRHVTAGRTVVIARNETRDAGGASAAAVRTPRLQWAPPGLHEPVTVTVTDINRHLYLRGNQDYVLDLPPNELQSGPLSASGGLVVDGGHDVVVIGGHIRIPEQELGFAGDPSRCQATCPPIATEDIVKRRGMLFQNATGTVHIEGVLLDGPDLSEGIELNTPRAVVQIENVRMENIHARDEVRFSDQHPDVIEPWGGVKELRVDRLTAETDYQAFKLHGTERPVAKATIRSANILGAASARYLIWTGDPEPEWPIQFADVWLRPGTGRSLRNSIYHPDLVKTAFDRVSEYAVIQDPLVSGVVRRGVPPGGDFVPRGVAGGSYRSPGYVGGRDRDG
jgi:hypothetical protein